MASDPNTLAELIDEIHWLSAELKRRTALRSEQQQVLLASKGLLNTLAEQGPRTVPAIAEARNTSRQNIQIIANRLAELGCIEFIPNPHHRKSDLVRLTPSGAALLKSTARQETAVLHGIAAVINPAETTALLDGLKQLRTILVGEPATDQESKSQPRRASTSRDHEPPPESGNGMPANKPSEPPIQGEEEPIQDDSLPVNLL